MELAPEQIFQIVGQLFIENKMLQQQVVDLTEKLKEKDEVLEDKDS